MKGFFKMLKIELKLTLRGMDMPIFALGLPIVIMAVLGFVYGGKPAYEGADFTALEQAFGAIATVGILASGVMGLPLVLSDYREKNILKRYHCMPVSTSCIFMVQIVKNAIYSIVSMLIVWVIAVCFGYRMSGNIAAFIAGFLLVMLSIYSIGMLVAALAPSSQKAGLICSILYFPMLIFSGTTIPYEIMPVWLQHISNILPLTQGIDLLKSISLGGSISEMIIPLTVLPIITVVCSLISLKVFRYTK